LHLWTPTALVSEQVRLLCLCQPRHDDLGTDATIHEHIKKIIDRQYVFKQQGYFHPSTLGIGLARGYDRIDLDHSLTKPLLRRKVSSIG
jgi:DNA topoisomerase-3